MATNRVIRRAMATARLVVVALVPITVVATLSTGLSSLAASASQLPSVRGHAIVARPGGSGLSTTGSAGAEASIAEGDLAAQFALSQLGKPYVYGAAGPYAYDCSGLAVASWRAAGVELPRTAAEQYYAGGHVPLGELQPGDLVFWASDVSDPATIYHVAISLGGTRTVQASRAGQPVQVVAIWAGGLVPWATRP